MTGPVRHMGKRVPDASIEWLNPQFIVLYIGHVGIRTLIFLEESIQFLLL